MLYRVYSAILILLISVSGFTQQPAPVNYSWQQAQVKVLANGGLEWAPKPFTFQPGASVRYIDFENGNDASDGMTKEKPWKHHPWDSKATDNAKACTGIHTYIFKRGVIYRGSMFAAESGLDGNPIQLTSDPAWGTGDAMIYGSERITGGWTQCTAETAPGIPEPEKVWSVNVSNLFPGKNQRISALWEVSGKSARRLNIARDPNWTISNPDDPTANWYRWETFKGFQNNGVLADAAHLAGKAADFYEGGWVWTQHKGLMGSVHRVNLKEYNAENGSFAISSPGGASYWPYGAKEPQKLNGRVRYYLENIRGYLDTAGEYYYSRTGATAGKLYLRLEDGTDPNKMIFEASKIRLPLQIIDKKYITVSGLTFRFNDDYDGKYGFPWYIGAAPCVRVVGNCTDFTVKNCKFYDVMNAVVAFPRPTAVGGPAGVTSKELGPFADDLMNNITICDNDVINADMEGAIWVNGASDSSEKFGRVKRVEVMRNRVINAGYRPGPSPTSSIPAISVVLPETAEIAGNIVDNSWGNGIFTLGGKRSGSTNEAPLSRILIHHNKVENTMLGCNDYGGLEMFQGGPAYFYNNIAYNTVGSKTFTGGELGYSLYLDGGFKIYSFNNILEGKVKENDLKYYNHCGYFMVFGFMDHLFNNTIHRFEYGMNGSSGNRSCILGNVVTDCSKGFMVQNRPGDVSMAFGGDTGEMGRIGVSTMSYGNNLFWGKPAGGKGGEGAFGMVGGTSAGGKAVTYQGKTLEELSKALEQMQSRVSQIGWHVDDMPLPGADKRDYRPAKESAVKDRGVKFFVPWGLYGMVGEWNFYKSASAPQIVLGEHFYMTDELMERGMYYHIPRNDLTVSACTAADYTAGPLEDWIDGALQFDGKTRYAVLTHAEMTRDMEYPGGKDGAKIPYKGSTRKTLDMDTNNFIIEVYFKTDAGHINGAIAGKTDQNGYLLAVDNAGKAALTLLRDGKVVDTAASSALVNDGKWHHLIAETDRKAGMMRIFMDGKLNSEKKISLAPDLSLANTADFLVGKTVDGKFFAGAIDFLRISRGSFADAKTSYAELYDWQFNGPALRDFTGIVPTGKRDAGAIEIGR